MAFLLSLKGGFMIHQETDDDLVFTRTSSWVGFAAYLLLIMLLMLVFL